MNYSIKIQLCDGDSVIAEIETEVADIEQGEQIIGVLSESLDNFCLTPYKHSQPYCSALIFGHFDLGRPEFVQHRTSGSVLVCVR